MSKYNCIVCETQFEGDDYTWSELQTRCHCAGKIALSIIDKAIATKTGFLCAKCESWLCSAEEKRLTTKSFWKGTQVSCPNCKKTLEFSKIILAENAFPSPQQMVQDQLEAGEKLEYYVEAEYGQEAVVTDRRFLYGSRPLKW